MILSLSLSLFSGARYTRGNPFKCSIRSIAMALTSPRHQEWRAMKKRLSRKPNKSRASFAPIIPFVLILHRFFFFLTNHDCVLSIHLWPHSLSHDSYVNLFKRYRYNILVIYSRQYNSVKVCIIRITMFISTIFNRDTRNKNGSDRCKYFRSYATIFFLFFNVRFHFYFGRC